MLFLRIMCVIFGVKRKKMTSIRSNFVNSAVDSVTGSDAIADHFANK